MSRPDVSNAVCELGKVASNPTLRHWKSLQHLLRYVTGSIEYDLLYPRQARGSTTLVGYCDAGFCRRFHIKKVVLWINDQVRPCNHSMGIQYPEGNKYIYNRGRVDSNAWRASWRVYSWLSQVAEIGYWKCSMEVWQWGNRSGCHYTKACWPYPTFRCKAQENQGNGHEQSNLGKICAIFWERCRRLN